jgi:serine/threonine-protein kinase TTK/MPS1
MLLAVHTIHKARIVHCDLRPANFVVVDGALKLIDFGISKGMTQKMSFVLQDTVGTIDYMAPEILM